MEIENDDMETKTTDTKLVEVVSGIITMGDSDMSQTHESYILLSQRVALKDYAWAWETPGGKLTEDEQVRAADEATRREALVMALRRELREELDIDINLTQSQPVAIVNFTTPRGRPLRVTFLRVRAFAGRPTSREHQGWGWFQRLNARSWNARPAR